MLLIGNCVHDKNVLQQFTLNNSPRHTFSLFVQYKNEFYFKTKIYTFFECFTVDWAFVSNLLEQNEDQSLICDIFSIKVIQILVKMKFWRCLLLFQIGPRSDAGLVKLTWFAMTIFVLLLFLLFLVMLISVLLLILICYWWRCSWVVCVRVCLCVWFPAQCAKMMKMASL